MTIALLFLLTLFAAGSASIAVGYGNLPLIALGTTLGILVGGLDTPETSAGSDDGKLGHRIQLWTVIGVGLALAVVLLLGRTTFELRLVIKLLLVTQLLALVFRSYANTTLPALANVQALTCVAVIAGGWLAAAAVAVTAALLVLWMGMVNHVRHRASTGAALAAVGPHAVLTGMLLGLALTALPAPRLAIHSRRGEPAPLPESMSDAFFELILWVIAGSVAMAIVRWFLLRRKDKDPAEDERDEEFRPAQLEELAPIEAPARRSVTRPGGVRGRIIERYLRLLGDLTALGRGRPAAATPLEHAATLPAPAAEIATVFGRARYGAEAVSEADLDVVDRAAVAVLTALRAGKRQGGVPPT